MDFGIFYHGNQPTWVLAHSFTQGLLIFFQKLDNCKEETKGFILFILIYFNF